MDGVSDTLGGTRYVRTTMFAGKSRIGLAPLYFRKIKNLRGKGQLTKKKLAEFGNIKVLSKATSRATVSPKKKILERVAIVLRARAEYLSALEFCSETEFSTPF